MVQIYNKNPNNQQDYQEAHSKRKRVTHQSYTLSNYLLLSMFIDFYFTSSKSTSVTLSPP